ncbi:MAG TPA: hypothetical protein VE224_10920, partial [Pseudolabrys sp.]|nr:hypothetical protein [Pseudolabrys sp.]
RGQAGGDHPVLQLPEIGRFRLKSRVSPGAGDTRLSRKAGHTYLLDIVQGAPAAGGFVATHRSAKLPPHQPDR